MWTLPDRWLALTRLADKDCVVELIGVGRQLPIDAALVSVS
jgi:hypothetical protein